jgi:diguanylate cyclase
MLQKDAEDNWEDAYRGLVSELETKERRWTAVESELRYAATQLAIAATGQSDELDNILTRIIDQIREAGEVLTPDIERLLETLKKADDRSTTHIEAEPDRDDTEAALDIRVIVHALTRRLAAVPDLHQVAAQIEGQCDTDDWSTALTNVANSIAQVVSSLNSERRELEEFLAGVTSQLAGFEQWTTWHLDDTQRRRDDNAELEESVASQVEHLNAAVEQTEDLSQLKTTVQSRLRAVSERIQKFREIEAQRLSDAETRNAALVSEIGRLRKRTHELSEICGDQENRLMVDSLTKLHSRYAYEQRMQQEFERWKNENSRLTYTLWDVDKFKSINDEYGHDAGDRLLRRIGLIMNKHKRQDDFVARIGGEEFVLLLPGKTPEQARGAADRLREAVASTPFNYRGTRRQITISCGITEFREGDTPLTVYKRADQALYDAKNGGRNRCVKA